MTKREIWRAVGKRIRQRESQGLCGALRRVTTGFEWSPGYRPDRIPDHIREVKRLMGFMPRRAKKNWYWWAPGSEYGRKQRIRVCRILAGDAK